MAHSVIAFLERQFGAPFPHRPFAYDRSDQDANEHAAVRFDPELAITGRTAASQRREPEKSVSPWQCE
jgi:hypothetical protein